MYIKQELLIVTLSLFLKLQESYSLLQKHGIQSSIEDLERVDTLRYLWSNLQEQIIKVQTMLIKVQPKFKANLEENVMGFKSDVTSFMGDYAMVSTKFIINYFYLLFKNYKAINYVLLQKSNVHIYCTPQYKYPQCIKYVLRAFSFKCL